MARGGGGRGRGLGGEKHGMGRRTMKLGSRLRRIRRRIGQAKGEDERGFGVRYVRVGRYGVKHRMGRQPVGEMISVLEIFNWGGTGWFWM